MSEDTEKGKQPGVAAQIAVGVLVALLAGGTAPWWWERVFGGPAPPAPPAHVSPAASDSQPSHPELSTSFFVGRWEVEQNLGSNSFASRIDYMPDGTFSGYMTSFVGGGGRKEPVQGLWSIEPITEDTVFLKLDFRVKPPGIPDRASLKFRVIDRDHTQNIDENYVANRIH